ncbi:1,4-alpha-glucan-branching [Hortaea werneckii]|nr:1,4-alpha-glucan-branching [Hortaea werneckii]
MAPGANVSIPKDVNPKTRDGLMKIVDVEYQNAQIDARWMNVVGWNRTMPTTSSVATPQPQNESSGGSLRSWFSRFTAGAGNAVNSASRKAQRDEEPSDCIPKIEHSQSTKKPPPKHTRIAILTSSYDESAAAVSTGAAAKQSGEIFSSVLPTKSGKIFIGFPTAQTTGLLAHISAPSVIPTVERESIDLNARYVRDWNVEMLRVAGIACRIAYTGEMAELRSKLDRTMSVSGNKKVSKEDVGAVMPSAIHAYKQYNFDESTPSSKVGGYIEEAFWMCNQKASIDVLSTRGVLPSHQVRVATEDLSFVDGIPVVPDELMLKANDFLTKLRDYGLLSDITTSDIKKELEAQALTEKQVMELVKWACQKVANGDMDSKVVLSLFDGTVAGISEEYVGTSSSPVLQLGNITSFINSAKIAAEMPAPPQTIPFRFTKGLNSRQLEAIGWEELQIVPPKLDSSSGRSISSAAELLMPRTVIPTKMGMRKPPQAYFGSVKLFEDLPTITGLQGVKEKFLSTLGVRKTIELNVVFDRLMAKGASQNAEEGKWSHVDLIKYLVSVKDDIPQEDLKRLRDTPICTAETQSGDQIQKGKLYRPSDLFEPGEPLRRLGLPLLQWPGPYRPSSPEGRFLKALGLQPYPSIPDLVNILSKAPTNSELQQSAITYWIMNFHHNGYSRHPMRDIQQAFLPVLPFAGEGNNMVAKPSQCYANPDVGALRFRVHRNALSKTRRRMFSRPDSCTQRLGEALIVPIADKSEKRPNGVRYIAPRSCYLGDGSTYGDIFDFVDFGHEANTFLLRVGSKHEPSAAELAGMVIRQPARLLQTLGHEKYLQLLRKIAESTEILKRDKLLWREMKAAPCLLGVKEVAKVLPGDEEKRDPEEEEMFIKEYSLATAASMVIVDDFGTYRLFQSSLLTAPQEETLEQLYSALETPWLSKLVEDDQRMGALQRDQTSAQRLQKLIVERCRLFLHDHTADVIRHDAKWLEQNLTVKTTEFLQITRRLKGYRMQFTEKRTAALHRESKRDAVLYVTAKYDLYEVSRAIMSLLLRRPRQQDYLALETILESDLRRLKTKGYNVDRILRARAAESRIAETERQKREEEQRRLMEAEAAKRPPQDQRAASIMSGTSNGAPNDVKNPMIDQPPPETPDRSLSMPGAFSESPEQQRPDPSGRGKKSVFSNLSKALGLGNNNSSPAGQQMQNLLGNNQSGPPDLPPPYEPHDPNGGKALQPGTERVSSPRDLQKNLESAIQSSRPYNSPSVFTRPQTNTINEEPRSYCDTKPGHDLTFLHELPNTGGIKLFLAKTSHYHHSPQDFLTQHATALTHFAHLLTSLSTSIFAPHLSPQTLNIFYDDAGSSIAFNTNGSLFCNLRFYLQLHHTSTSSSFSSSPEARVEAGAYWWITLCHELAHNLVAEHSAQHSYYTESFVAHYFRRMVWRGRRMHGDEGRVREVFGKTTDRMMRGLLSTSFVLFICREEGKKPNKREDLEKKEEKEKTHHSRPRRHINLQEILPAIPLEIRGKEPTRFPHDAISPRLLDADAVIGKGAGRVEVEDPEQARALEDDDFVPFVFEGDVGLRGVQPAVLGLGVLHGGVEVVELAAGVVEGVVVALAREVEPFRVAELVAFEVQVGFAPEPVRDQPDHLVQRHAAFDDGGEFREGGHVRVHLGVAEPEEEGLVADEGLVVGFGVGDGFFAVATVGQGEAEVAHVPVDVLLLFQPFDVEVRYGHGESVVESYSA